MLKRFVGKRKASDRRFYHVIRR